MVTKAQLLKAAAERNVTVEIAKSVASGGRCVYPEITLTAPDGFNMDGDVHEFVISGYQYELMGDLYADAYARLTDPTTGPHKCAIPECEWCGGL